MVSWKKIGTTRYKRKIHEKRQSMASDGLRLIQTLSVVREPATV
jgi:hypothetical protein